jgi:hypothetical protein
MELESGIVGKLEYSAQVEDPGPKIFCAQLNWSGIKSTCVRTGPPN